MYNIALHIKAKDWLYILLTGVVFSMFLSTLGYSLLEYSLLDGALYGVLLGFCITLFSLLFISYMNRNILPNIAEFYWLPLSILFSFLSGFLGTILGTLLASFFSLKILKAFEEQMLGIAFSIGVLTYIVGALLYRFVKMRNEKEVIDNEYVQSRLRSLETQLNPHFLFNALNSIAELIHQDPNKAEMAILQVSTFLRNSMNEKALLRMRDEIRNVKDYVALENIRFSGRIKLHLPHAIPEYYLPKFSIQLLVENAIKHGFTSQKNDLNITIEIVEAKRGIVVKNDGEPMRTTHFGIGLNNLKQRLELLCKASIEIIDTKVPTFYILVGECNENTHSR